jgi:thiosulfate reductase/polysulfide reductase chain A
VILPESTYLERTDCVQQANGLKPQMFLRRQAVSPRYDTRDGAMILKQIADRIGTGHYFPYENMDELVRWQLEGTGFTMEDFDAKGFVAYGKSKIFWDRTDGLKLKTPSKKIEFKSSLLEDAGFESLPAYESMPTPRKANSGWLPAGPPCTPTCRPRMWNISTSFAGKTCCGSTTRRLPNWALPTGPWWRSPPAATAAQMRAYVTDLIHPDCVFLLHGFGHQAKRAERSYNRGVSDAALQENLYDKVGGSPAYHDTFVNVKAA